MGTSSLVGAASTMAAVRTTALAATQPAATTKPVAAASPPPSSHNYVLEIDNLKKAAHKACYVDADPKTCSYYSQRLGSAEAAMRTMSSGENSRMAAYNAATTNEWLALPARVAGVRAVSPDVSAVAITKTALKLQAQQGTF